MRFGSCKSQFLGLVGDINEDRSFGYKKNRELFIFGSIFFLLFCIKKNYLYSYNSVSKKVVFFFIRFRKGTPVYRVKTMSKRSLTNRHAPIQLIVPLAVFTSVYFEMEELRPLKVFTNSYNHGFFPFPLLLEKD